MEKHAKWNTCLVIGVVGFFLFFGEVAAQQVVVSSGGSSSGTGGSVSYTIGQVVYTTVAGTNGSVSQGVQQPYEISTVTGINQSKGVNLSFLVYPNPVADYLTLKVEDIKTAAYTFSIYDFNGKLLLSKKVDSQEMKISMKLFLPATYLLKVSQMKNGSTPQEIKTFKIIKY
jgi:hypothetical protein